VFKYLIISNGHILEPLFLSVECGTLMTTYLIPLCKIIDALAKFEEFSDVARLSKWDVVDHIPEISAKALRALVWAKFHAKVTISEADQGTWIVTDCDGNTLFHFEDHRASSKIADYRAEEPPFSAHPPVRFLIESVERALSLT